MDARRYSGGSAPFGLTGPVPTDVWWLLGCLFVTFSLRFFASTASIPQALELGPGFWQRGFLWQVLTYPFVGSGAPGLWFVLELLILFLFARQAIYQLGRRRFWRLLAIVSVISALVAVVAQLLSGPDLRGTSFALMQGQRMLLAILVAVFAVLNRHATILLFFVLPIQARWFLALEIVFAFLGFLSTRDLAGFLGICAAVATTVSLLSPGGLRTQLRDLRLRGRAALLRWRLRWLRRRRGMHVVEPTGDRRRDPWVH